MTNPPDINKPIILGNENQEEFNALARLFERSTEFSLSFVFCADVAIELEIKRRLEQRFNIASTTMEKDDDDIFLFLEQTAAGLERGRPIFVNNLHPLINNPEKNLIALGNLNLRRNSLPDFLTSPIIFWLQPGDEARFMSFAPDFWSWRGACFYFYPFYPDREFTPEFHAPDFQSDFYQKTLTKIKELEDKIKKAEKIEPKTITLKKKIAAAHLAKTGLFIDLTKYVEAKNELIIAEEIYKNVGDLLGEANSVHMHGDILHREFKYNEAKDAFKNALTLYKKESDLLGEANCIFSLGDIFFRESKNNEARKAFEKAISLFHKVGDLLGEANCIFSLGDIFFRESKNNEARKAFEKAKPLYRKVGDLLGEANCVRSLGDIFFRESKNTEALDAFEKAIPLFRKVGSLIGEANCIKNLGDLFFIESKNREALEAFKKARLLYRKVGNIAGVANCNRGFGYIAFRYGNVEPGIKEFKKARLLYEKINDKYSIANCAEGLAYNLKKVSNMQKEAKNAFGEAVSIYREIGLDADAERCKKKMEDMG